MVISIVGWSIFLGMTLLNSISQSLLANAQYYTCEGSWCRWEYNESLVTSFYVLSGISGALGFFGTIFSTYFICRARQRIRARDRIPGSASNDCCASYWCPCCSVIQMFKQERIDGTSYSVCSPTGTLRV